MKASLKTKSLLNPREAIELFHLNERRFRALLKEGSLPFLGYYGSRKLIIREEFEKYLSQHPELRGQRHYRRKEGLPNNEKFMLTRPEAIQFFRVDEDTLKRIAENVKSGIVLKSGGRYFFNRQRLEQYLKGSDHLD